MNEDLMRKTSLVVARACIVLAFVIFVFADGARRMYAGACFAMLGVVMAVSATRANRSQP